MADFGYDVADYCDIDPIFGDLAEFDRLVADCHARGIRVVLDWVPNHTSIEHPWFVESRSSRDNPKRDWYVWRDPGPTAPRRTTGGPLSAVDEPAWTLDPATGQAYLHCFLPEQPDLNWDHPEVEAAMLDTLRFWLDRGVDGFRMDVIDKIAKDPELRDNPAEPADAARPRHDEDWPTIADRLRRIRDVVDSYEDRMLVGEVHIHELGRLVEYVNTGDQLHMVHNFSFMYLPWEADAMRASVDHFEELSTDHAWPAWFLGSHDHSRVVSRYGGGELGRARARVAAMLLYTLRGTPFIYQGEELGLPDAEIPAEAIVDVDGRDPERARFRGSLHPGRARAQGSRPTSPGSRASPKRSGSACGDSSTTPARCSRWCGSSPGGAGRSLPACGRASSARSAPEPGSSATSANSTRRPCWSCSTSSRARARSRTASCPAGQCWRCPLTPSARAADHARPASCWVRTRAFCFAYLQLANDGAPMSWLDVSAPITGGMVHWPGDPPVRIDLSSSIEGGDPANVSHLDMSAHTGTHLDAPRHFFGTARGSIPCLSRWESARLGYRGRRVRRNGPAEALRDAEVGEGERILVRTRDSNRDWAHEQFDHDFVGLSPGAQGAWPGGARWWSAWTTSPSPRPSPSRRPRSTARCWARGSG